MSKITIYHNPRCSKSRQTLALLQEQDCDISIREYLKQPPSLDELQEILNLLGYSEPRMLMRTKEAEYKQQNLGSEQLNDKALLTAMINTPKLIERPIVISGTKAVIGRPPENVLTLFNPK